MLFLIGMGLTNKDMSLSAFDALAKSDEILVDPYTNYLTDEDLEYLKEKVGKAPALLGRSDLEENAKLIIAKAKEKNIALLVSGDPLIATTHHTILDLAHKAGVKFTVYHAASIFSAAIGESGLDIYKFGPTTTITFWTEKYKPVSFIDVIKKNLDNDQHTLALFHYDYFEKRKMRLGEAIPLLHTADEIRKHGTMTAERKLLILGDVGKETQSIKYVAFGKIDKAVLREFEGKLLVIIVPGKLNFAEEEALSKFV